MIVKDFKRIFMFENSDCYRTIVISYQTQGLSMGYSNIACPIPASRKCHPPYVSSLMKLKPKNLRVWYFSTLADKLDLLFPKPLKLLI